MSAHQDAQHIINTPVLIVGAGAAGSMLALELARFGIDFRMVDRLEGPSPYSKAVTVHARSLEILERIDPTLLQQFLDLGIHCPGYIMHFVGKDGIRREVRPGLDFSSLPSNYPMLLLNAQNDTERLLREYLHSEFDRSPEWGCSCTDVVVEADSVLATLSKADGSSEQLRANYVVACDGAGSRIREQLGLIQEGSDYAGTVLQNLDIEIEGFPDEPDWAHYCMGPGHFVMVVRLPGGIFRLLMSQPAEQADADATAQTVFSDILAKHFDGLRFGKTRWHSRWQSHVRLAKHYRKGNVFLAGDAAHVHSTAGGQGMNCCMQDAYNLAWKLAYVIQAKAGPDLLDSYEQERKPIGAQVIAAASEIHDLFMAGRSSTPEEMLQLQASGAIQELIGKVSGIAYHYREEKLADNNSTVLQAGDRAPDAALAGEPGNQLYDYTRHTAFTLLATADDDAAGQLGPVLKHFAQHYAGLLKTAALTPAPAAYRASGGQPQLFLIRPDGYLALSCALDDSATLDAYLAALSI